MRRGILTDVKVNYNLAVHIIESKVKKNISEYSHPFIFLTLVSMFVIFTGDHR